jgi:hypothetical protein
VVLDVPDVVEVQLTADMRSPENHAENPDGPASDSAVSEAIVSSSLALQISTYPAVSSWDKPMPGVGPNRSSPPRRWRSRNLNSFSPGER